MDDNTSRYAFLPIEHHNLAIFYQKQKNALWVPAEVNMSSDRTEWLKLSDDERKFLTFILAFFAQADGLVIENLTENFQSETSEFKDARAFYSAQNFIETIHNEMYSILIETFIQDLDERNKALNAIKHYPSIASIAGVMKEWMDPSRPLLERIIAFACVEGIIFSGAFCAIYWIKNQNKLRGLCKANEFIARDEGLHTEFAIALYHHYVEKIRRFSALSQETVHNIIKGIMAATEIFIEDALKVELIGMSSERMIEYVRCTADHLSEALGYEKIYGVENPFDWMIKIALSNKTNFFEDSVSEYSKVQDSDTTFDRHAPF